MQTHVSATNNPRPVVWGLLLIITMSKAQICSLLLIITMSKAQICSLLLIITMGRAQTCGLGSAAYHNYGAKHKYAQ